MKSKSVSRDEQMVRALNRAFEIVGGPTRMAEALNLTRTACHQWRRGLLGATPVEHCLTISELTSIPVTELRPDVFGGIEDLEKQVYLIKNKVFPEKVKTEKKTVSTRRRGREKKRPRGLTPRGLFWEPSIRENGRDHW